MPNPKTASNVAGDGARFPATSRFDEKVALVTGGRSGIGRAIADRLRREGAWVFTAQRREDPQFDAIHADFSDPSSTVRVVETLIAQTGRLDVLINSAGMMQEASIEEMTLEDWQHNLMVNLTTPFLIIQAALPYLRKTRGNIVNIGSIEGLGANSGHAAYCTSKAGLHGLTRAVAVDHGNEGIRCNAVAPGWIDTKLNRDFIGDLSDPTDFHRGIERIHPIGRSGAPEEIAALVAFLASEDASFITGQVYTADGGRMAKLSLP